MDLLCITESAAADYRATVTLSSRLYVVRVLCVCSVKIVTEMVNALLDKDDGSKIICMITQISQQQKREKGAKTKRPNVITLVTEALLTNLQAVESIEAIHLPPLLRACETLGRFLVHR